MNTTNECENRPLIKVNLRGLRGALALLLLLPVAAWAGGMVTTCTKAALRAAIAGGGTVAFVCDGTITLAMVALSNSSQFCFDVSEPLPPQRFYRAWQSGTLGVIPTLSLPGMIPALTLTGNIGDSLRVDYINQFGPVDAWVTLGTVKLTNTSQLFFDTSSIGQPARLWRIVPVP